MTRFYTLVFASVLSSLSVVVAFAQTDRTGTGGGPLSTEKAPNTTIVGQTKPPSRDASPSSVAPIERLTPRQLGDSAITRRICIGCDPGTDTTPLAVKLKIQTGADRLTFAGQPEKQSDLDTVALASAHREQAVSTQEKTNGLWQSWLVSVCEGCGDQKPYRRRRLEDWPARDAPLATGSVNPKASPGAHQSSGVKHAAYGHHGDLAADLAPENVASIRRMPQ
jgi:hypothetical protein